jgi:hypothetical protein
MVLEDAGNFAMLMDRGIALGNSNDASNRRALHVKNINQVIASWPWLSFQYAYPDSVTEVISFYSTTTFTGLLGTVTLVYTTSTKEFLASGTAVAV